MLYTPSDLRQRHAFIDRGMEAFLDELHHPETKRALGELATGLTATAHTAFVANIEDGAITVPDEYAKHSDALAVVALRPGERLQTSHAFEIQTETQRHKTVNTFKKWGSLLPPESTYNRVFGVEDDGHRSTFGLNGTDPAMTGIAVTVLSERRITELFLDGPPSGVAFMKKRPLLILAMPKGKRAPEIDTIGHELTHVKQALQAPVTIITSQKASEMNQLRIELEAYHIGSIFYSLRLLNKKTRELSPVNSSDPGALQMYIEILRKEYDTDPNDPYKPSVLLMNAFKEKNLTHIIHSGADYDTFLSIIKQAEADEAACYDASNSEDS